MNASIIEAIEKEIAGLQRARDMLAGSSAVSRGGRPKGSKNASKLKRVMSAETRARMSAGQKKRQAAKRRAAKKQVAETA